MESSEIRLPKLPHLFGMDNSGPKYILINKDLLLRSIHYTVSTVIFISIAIALTLIQTTDMDFNDSPFIVHGFNYVYYLLSIWVSVSQVIFFNTYTAIDILDVYYKDHPNHHRLKETFHKVGSYLLFMVVFPLSVLVAILFWTFYHWRRDAMYPEEMDRLFPPILNHIMHTCPSFAALFYMFTSTTSEPPIRRTLPGLLAVILVYTAVVIYIKHRDGCWVYIVIGTLTPHQVKALFVLCLLGSISFLLLGYYLNNKMNGRLSRDKETLVRVWHGSVSLASLACIVTSMACVAMADVDFASYEYCRRGFKYFSFLLSLWATAAQVVYFNIYSAIDILDIYSKRNPKLLSLKNKLHDAASYMLFMLVFPLSVLVTVLFWTFYFWKREEMYPQLLDRVFPPILNHVMHTLPAFLSVTYMFTSNQREPPKTKALAGLLAVITVYCSCVLSIKVKDGKWVYLVIDSLTPTQLKCVFAFCIVGSVSFLFLGYLINDKIRAIRNKLLD